MNIQGQTQSQLPMNIHRNYQRNLTAEYLVIVQKCQAILNKAFVLRGKIILWACIKHIL